MATAKRQTDLKTTLASLSIREKQVVVEMLSALLHHQKEETGILIVGVSPKDLEVPGITEANIHAECEKLVEKGVFARQLGEAASVGKNAHLSHDRNKPNWYSFHSDFVEALDSQDLYWVIGFFVGSMIGRLPIERQQLFFETATRSLLQGTYL